MEVRNGTAEGGTAETRVYAVAAIAAGEWIGEHEGEIVTEEEAARMYMGRAAGHLIEVEEGVYLDGRGADGSTARIRAAEDSNVDVEVEVATRRADVYAARAIAAGEELLRSKGAGRQQRPTGKKAEKRAGSRRRGRKPRPWEVHVERRECTSGSSSGTDSAEDEWSEEEGDRGGEWREGQPPEIEPERDKTA